MDNSGCVYDVIFFGTVHTKARQKFCCDTILLTSLLRSMKHGSKHLALMIHLQTVV